jgi:cytochrome c-type biogenesis protein CcmH
LSNPVFLLAATAAVLLSLVFVLVPLLGARQRVTLTALLVVVPAATLGIYAMVGTPGGVDPDTGQTGEIRSVITDLARRAMREPDNAEHWARLGLAYKSLEEFSSAEHAFRRALYINADAAFIKAELGETLLYASGEPELPDEARSLLAEAADDGIQKAIWLLGLDAYQREEFEAAAERFERLLALLPPESSVRPTVEQYLATARSGGLPAGHPTTTQSDPATGPTLSLTVGIAPELGERLEGNETVFVAVRRASGGPPLAVRRLSASDLPAVMDIDDGDAMMAGNGLSSAGEVVVTARVSFSGDATPQDGDFEGRSDILPVEEDLQAEVIIDQIR